MITRIRQHIDFFISHVSKAYKVYIYTQATRKYAEQMVRWIDPKNLLKIPKESYKDRILTRTEDQNHTKTLSKVLPSFKHMVILDDRMDVWPGIRNLIVTKPFYYFQFEKIQPKDPKEKPRKSADPFIPLKNDNFLFFMTHLLMRLQREYYTAHQTDKTVVVTDILTRIQKQVFNGNNVIFSRIPYNPRISLQQSPQ
jgi:TFIIF-interacting CTD phosphatase-like protein